MGAQGEAECEGKGRETQKHAEKVREPQPRAAQHDVGLPARLREQPHRPDGDRPQQPDFLDEGDQAGLETHLRFALLGIQQGDQGRIDQQVAEHGRPDAGSERNRQGAN